MAARPERRPSRSRARAAPFYWWTTRDPLSSQGILTALYTGMKAGQALHAHPPGDSAALGAYAERLETVYAAYRQNYSTYCAYRGAVAGAAVLGAAEGGLCARGWLMPKRRVG